MKLASLLPKEAVLPCMSARDKKQALKLLSVHAAALTSLNERDIYSVLQAREQIGCTGMGAGVCIPHGRFPGLKSLHAVFARLEHPINFDAPDGKPVDLIFLLLTPGEANTEHLKALALISRLLRDKNVCKELRGSRDAAALHALLIKHAEGDA